MSLTSLSGILNQPLAAPPQGQSSNFTDRQTEGPVLTAICSLFLALMILFFGARIYARRVLTQKLGWDDLTCTIGFLLTIFYFVLSEISVIDGYVGYHSWDVKVGELGNSPFYITSYLQSLVNPAGLLFIKLTFFILYMNIFKPLKNMRIAILGGAIISTVFYLLIIILALAFATPRAGQSWETHLVSPLENDEVHLAIPQAAISVLLDFYILILPIYGVWKLQLSKQRKIAVSLVFMTGFMACIASILSLYYRAVLENSKDLLQILLPTLITSLVEMEIGVICSCAPALSLIGRKLKARGLFSSDSTRSSGGYWSRSGLYFWRRNTNLSGRSGDSSYVAFDAEHGRDPKKAVEAKTYDLELGNMNSIQTFIGSGKKGSVRGEDDGIHLKHDILQESIKTDSEDGGQRG